MAERKLKLVVVCRFPADVEYVILSLQHTLERPMDAPQLWLMLLNLLEILEAIHFTGDNTQAHLVLSKH